MNERVKRNLDDLNPATFNPGADAATPGLEVAFLCNFPRSVVGEYQDDPLMMSILRAKAEGSINELSAARIIEAISVRWDSSYRNPMRDYIETRWPRAIDFFQAVIERLRHLETYQPAAGDFAIEALQDAFAGLMYDKYAWGKTGLPTKGEVREMAKSLLERQNRVIKSGWTKLLQTSGLGWLPEGAAGRPSKADMDENEKASREAHAILTQAIQDVHNGDAIRVRDALRAYLGGKTEYQRSERDRLSAPAENDQDDGVLE